MLTWLLTLSKELNAKYTTKDLVDAIPAYCFKASHVKSFGYLARDFLVAGTVMYVAYNYIPKIEIPLARWIAWATYGYFQGQQMTGIWVRRTQPRAC